MASCGTFQTCTQHKWGVLWFFWASLVLSSSWIVWWGIWRINCSAYGEKPGSPSCTIAEGSWLTIDWPCSPSYYRLLSHLYSPPPGWWGFEMDSWLELVGLLLSPGYFLGPKSKFSRCLPRKLPLWAPFWHIAMFLGLGAPWNPPSWEQKVLIGHQNRVPRLVPW